MALIRNLFLVARRPRFILLLLLPALVLFLYKSSHHPSVKPYIPLKYVEDARNIPYSIPDTGQGSWAEYAGLGDEMDEDRPPKGVQAVAGWLGLGAKTKGKRRTLLMTGGAGSLGE
jgi:hypothetical protein